MKFHIMTWNCDLYRERLSSLNWKRYNAIVNIVKGRLELENSIAALQEIPYESNETWAQHPFCQKLLEDFPKDEYEIVYSVSTNPQIMMSIIIFKKSAFEKEDDTDIGPDNRIVCCRKDDIVFVCVHMPTNLRERKLEDARWDRLIASAKKKKAAGDKAIILGDFNAYIGCDDKFTESKFIDLLHYADNITPDDLPTFKGGTPIDHILVNFNLKTKKYQIEERFEWSDHKYIMAEIEV